MKEAFPVGPTESALLLSFLAQQGVPVALATTSRIEPQLRTSLIMTWAFDDARRLGMLPGQKLKTPVSEWELVWFNTRRELPESLLVDNEYLSQEEANQIKVWGVAASLYVEELLTSVGLELYQTSFSFVRRTVLDVGNSVAIGPSLHHESILIRTSRKVEVAAASLYGRLREQARSVNADQGGDGLKV